MTSYYPAPIAAVAPRSVAARAGLRAGDVLLALNGAPVRDVIDVQVLAAEPELDFLIERDGQRLELHARRRYGAALGLEFATALFDGPVRACRNACEFCFVAQMAPGLRAPLYVKDDDYRLSFLNGSYITLTNLSAADWERIAAQSLSPLYVSVHATEPDVRVALMRNPHAGDVLAQVQRLVAQGIQVHTQAVLLPGRNDGAHLERTLGDLAALHPGVVDVTVVPVGLTRYHAPALRPYSDAEATVVLEQVLVWQARFRETLGVGFAYPSDEWFLRAGQSLPPLAAYDDLLPALIENGVGMVSLFQAHQEALFAVLAAAGGARQTWVTGTLFAPVLRAAAEAFTRAHGIPAEVVAVTNRAFGETVTVAGLLTVADVVATVCAGIPGEVIVLPAEMFRGPEGRSLDEALPEAVAQASGRRVVVIEQQGAEWHVCRDVAQK